MSKRQSLLERPQVGHPFRPSGIHFREGGKMIEEPDRGRGVQAPEGRRA